MKTARMRSLCSADEPEIRARLTRSCDGVFIARISWWLHILSADHHSDGVRAVVLHDDEDLALLRAGLPARCPLPWLGH
jgi:hypothetical protein